MILQPVILPFLFFLLLFIYLMFNMWQMWSERREKEILTKIIVRFHKTHPDDPCFVAVTNRHDDEPEVVRFHARDCRGNVVEFMVDGSRVEVKRIPPDDTPDKK